MANTQSFSVLCVFCITLLLSVNHLVAEADPDVLPRHFIYQPYFTPVVSSSSGPVSRFYRPSPFVGYNPSPEVAEDYESAALMAKMSRLLDSALVQLREEVDNLKQQLKTETERSRRLEQQVDHLKQSATIKQENFGEDERSISQYARFNGALTTALGLGRPWVRTFFSFRKSSPFTATGTPITYDITDANVGSTVVSGIFTAPRAGYYYFSFNGVSDASVYPVNAAMFKNGNLLTTSYGTAASYSPLSIQELLILNPSDTISIQLQIPSGQNSSTTGTLYEDGSSYFTRFTGFSVALL